MTCRGHAPAVEQFARDNQDILQVVGVGSQSDFVEVQQFLTDAPMNSATMLWEETGKVWQLNNARTNSAMQLYSYDLAEQSGLIFFNDKGRSIVLDASIQTPWAPISRLD